MKTIISLNMQTLTPDDVLKLFQQKLADKQVKQFKKFGTVKARPVTREERVVTHVDGEVETYNIAHPGDYIITGRGNEEYVVPAKTFKDRYEALPNGLYRPIGTCFAFQYHGPEIQFKASWGEMMRCKTGDFIASIYEDGRDPYRIAQTVFAQTYR